MTKSSNIGDLFSSERAVTRFAFEAIVVEGLAADQNAGVKSQRGEGGAVVRARERGMLQEKRTVLEVV